MDIQINFKKIENGWVIKTYDGIKHTEIFSATPETAIHHAVSRLNDFVKAVLNK